MAQKFAVYSNREQVGATVDLDSAGSITIGGTDATSVSIGRSGVVTNILGNYSAGQLPPTGVVPGSYTNSDVTVDASGRIVAISNGAGGGSTGAKPTLADKSLAPLASTGVDDFDTGITLTITPDTGSFVAVRVNGFNYDVAQTDAQRTASPFYFGAVAGVADDMVGLAAGSKLFFNEVVAGFALTVTDLIDIDYDETHVAPSVPSLNDKNLTPAASTGVDDFNTTLTLTDPPSASSYVGVRVNGTYYRVAQDDTERPLSVFYFGTVGGTADNMATLAGGETLYFNEVVAGFALTGTDIVEFDYNTDLGAIATVAITSNKDQAPAASSGADDFDTGLVLANGPVANGYVGVRLNGLHYRVAQDNTERATSPFYFGTIAGTAVPMASLAAGHKLFFNAAFTGFDTATSDRIDMDYNSVFTAPVAAVVVTLENKYQTPSASAGADDFDTGLTILGAPAANSYVAVYLNGLRYRVAQTDAQRTTSVFYFGAVAGTALPMISLTTGNKLFFNAVVAGFDITTADKIDIDYLE